MKYTAHVSGICPEQFSSLKSARTWVRTRSVRDGAYYSITRSDKPDPLQREVEAGELWRSRMFRDR